MSDEGFQVNKFRFHAFVSFPSVFGLFNLKKVHLKETKGIRNAIFENPIVRNWISSGLLCSSSKIWWRGWCKEHFLSNKRMSDFASFFFNYKTNCLLLGIKYSHFQTSTTWKQNKIGYISIREKMFFWSASIFARLIHTSEIILYISWAWRNIKYNKGQIIYNWIPKQQMDWPKAEFDNQFLINCKTFHFDEQFVRNEIFVYDGLEILRKTSYRY